MRAVSRFGQMCFLLAFAAMPAFAIHDAVVLKSGNKLYGKIMSVDSSVNGISVAIDANITDETGKRRVRKTVPAAQIKMIRLNGKVYPDYALPIGYVAKLSPPPPKPKPPKQPSPPLPRQTASVPAATARPSPTPALRPIKPRQWEQTQKPSQRMGMARPEFLKREPAAALFTACVLPGGGSLYNRKTGMVIVHHVFQVLVPGVLAAIPTKDDRNTTIKYSVAWSSFALSKIVDMYRSVIDAQHHNRRLAEGLR